MPKEYLACRDSMIKKGVSEKTAKARCAIMYFKRHGISVNEAEKKGYASFPDLEGLDENDMKLIKLISTNLSDLNFETEAAKPDTHGEEENVKAINMDFLDEFGVLEIIATRTGASAYTGTGQAVTWTERALKKAAPTWTGGTVSINHNGKDYGRIIASFFENGVVRMLVKVNDALKGWLKKFGKHVGVSIEAMSVKLNKKFDVTEARGTGVTFVFPPEVPACSPDEGCGITATETVNKTDEKCECEEDKPVEGVISTAPSYPWFETSIDGNVIGYNVPITNLPPNVKVTYTVVTPEPPNNISEDNKNGGTPLAEDHLEILKGKSETDISAVLEELDGAKLSYQERKGLPDSAFCGPDRSFPAQDAAHVRNGLARLPQAKGLSESQRSAIHSCLTSRAKKYGIEVSESKGTVAETPVEEPKLEAKEVDKMVEEQKPAETKPAETICAKKHESIVKAKDSEIEALKKENDSLKATVAQFNTEKKAKLLETMNKEYGLDTKQYESKEIPVIEDILTTLKAVKEKQDKEPEVNSGAVIKATEQQTVPEGNAASKAVDDAAQKAADEAKKLQAEMSRINEKAEKVDGKKRKG